MEVAPSGTASAGRPPAGRGSARPRVVAAASPRVVAVARWSFPSIEIKDMNSYRGKSEIMSFHEFFILMGQTHITWCQRQRELRVLVVKGAKEVENAKANSKYQDKTEG
ncbi:hypothetical protein BHE74_00038828 [Ensete ventricosum]|nr:hypothetical protein BHE74_00038828 [Ensete ventricosum]